MVDMIIALSSGLFGGLITTVIKEKYNRLRCLLVFVFTVLGMVFSWRVALEIFAGNELKIGAWFAGLSWSFQPDPLGALFGIIVSTLWLFAAVYSFGYMKGKSRQRTYYAFFLFSLTATLGVAFAGNLLALYLFYELLTLATYPLVIHQRTPEALQAGKKYILYSFSGAGVLLLAIVITYALAGHLNFSTTPILANCNGTLLNWLLAIFIVGFGVKAAIIPLHRWLPAAMVAPTPISALLHAVAVVYSGVYGILRVVYSVFGHKLMGSLPFADALPWIAAFTILVGVFIATQQDVLKRRLAYNTIGELSYILLGAFTLQAWGLAGALIHMIGYSTVKITLFFCAGIIAEKTEIINVSRMKGVGHILPKTMIAFGLASIGIIGMLPLGTFWSKYYLMKGSVSAGSVFLALVLIISGIINAVCFVPIIVSAFKEGSVQQSVKKGTGLNLMLIPTLILISVAILVGLCPGLVWPGVQSIVDWFF